MKKEQVKKLRINADRAKLHYEVLGQTNTIGLAMDERLDLDLEYRLAKERWTEAELQYEQALTAWIKGAPK